MASAAPRMVVVAAIGVLLLLCLSPQLTAAARASSAHDDVLQFETQEPLLREVTSHDLAKPLGSWAVAPCSPRCEACKAVCVSDCRGDSKGYCFEQCLFNDRCYSYGF
ncbi:hypothetical protein SEVIR_9G102400v4 [Setaria viridis]|uniref:Uncharacterized protein n=1 Tax=Setaria viridis TaxID=4556 RepID=A0A4U6SU18_SETVI|nr:hypothetical protein SEVIR_9G102400v2 [Setaria viridis]